MNNQKQQGPTPSDLPAIARSLRRYYGKRKNGAFVPPSIDYLPDAFRAKLQEERNIQIAGSSARRCSSLMSSPGVFEACFANDLNQLRMVLARSGLKHPGSFQITCDISRSMLQGRASLWGEDIERPSLPSNPRNLRIWRAWHRWQTVRRRSEILSPVANAVGNGHCNKRLLEEMLATAQQEWSQYVAGREHTRDPVPVGMRQLPSLETFLGCAENLRTGRTQTVPGTRRRSSNRYDRNDFRQDRGAYQWLVTPISSFGGGYSLRFYVGFEGREKKRPKSGLWAASCLAEELIQFLFSCMRTGVICGEPTLKIVPILCRHSIADGGASIAYVRLSMTPAKNLVLTSFSTRDLESMSTRKIGSILKAVSHMETLDPAVEAYASQLYGLDPHPDDSWSKALALLKNSGERDPLRMVLEPLGIDPEVSPE